MYGKTTGTKLSTLWIWITEKIWGWAQSFYHKCQELLGARKTKWKFSWNISEGKDHISFLKKCLECIQEKDKLQGQKKMFSHHHSTVEMGWALSPKTVWSNYFVHNDFTAPFHSSRHQKCLTCGFLAICIAGQLRMQSNTLEDHCVAMAKGSTLSLNRDHQDTRLFWQNRSPPELVLVSLVLSLNPVSVNVSASTHFLSQSLTWFLMWSELWGRIFI